MLDAMTVLDSFVAFAKSLPADRLGPVEDMLAMLMSSYSDEQDFSDQQLAELDRRLAEPRPRFVEATVIEQLFGRSLPK